MSTIEERLRAALQDEAAAHEVDLAALRAATRARLDTRPRRTRTVLAPLAAAAAVVLVVGGLAATVLDRGRDDGPAGGGGPVDDRFTCAVQVDVDLSGGQDEFVPDLSGRTPEDVAREAGAPRWVFEERGATAQLRLGNDDGTLGSITTYRRQGERWELVSSRVCSGAAGSPEVPLSDPYRLGRHGTEPYPPRGVLDVAEPGITPVLLDDRAAYDYSGLVTTHRSGYAAPCGRRLCLAFGDPQGGVVKQLVAREEASVVDISGLATSPDDLVGRRSPYLMWAVWDTGGQVRSLEAGSGSGSGAGAGVREGQVFTDPSWQGRVLHLLLAPRDDTAWVRLTRSDGTVVQQAPAEVVGYSEPTG